MNVGRAVHVNVGYQGTDVDVGHQGMELGTEMGKGCGQEHGHQGAGRGVDVGNRGASAGVSKNLDLGIGILRRGH